MTGPSDSNVSKAFDFAQDVTKQLITLATAIVTFSLAFLKDIAANASQDARDWLTRAWVFYFVSIVLGLFTLMRLTGELQQNPTPTIYGPAIRWLSFFQIILFGLAMGMTLWFGLNAQPRVT